MATHSSMLAWRIPRDRGARWATLHGVIKSQTQLSDQAHTVSYIRFLAVDHKYEINGLPRVAQLLKNSPAVQETPV